MRRPASAYIPDRDFERLLVDAELEPGDEEMLRSFRNDFAARLARKLNLPVARQATASTRRLREVTLKLGSAIDEMYRKRA